MKLRSNQQMLTTNTIVSHYAGSLSYGTNLPSSDVDIRGIFVADRANIMCPWSNGGVVSASDEDTSHYELTKYMMLLITQNPNIIETLWVDEKHIIGQPHPAYSYLREHRDELLSSQAKFTFSGYAHSQLKRIKGHNNWLNNPQPESAPRQCDYLSLVLNLTPDRILTLTPQVLMSLNDHHSFIKYGGDGVYGIIPNTNHTLVNELTGALNVCDRDTLDPEVRYHPIMLVQFNQQQYKDEKNVHSKYWEWVNNRNKSRSELEAKFGYDTKHGMHLIRLMLMCKEILADGVVSVNRPDASHLLDIRRGNLTYSELLEYAETLEDECNQLYKTTTLQRTVSQDSARTILFNTREIFWQTQESA